MRLVRSPGLTSTQLNLTVKGYEENDLPALSDVSGCIGFVLGENHAAGNFATISFWDSLEAMEDSKPVALEARERAAIASDARLAPIFDQYEVTFQQSLDTFAGVGPGSYSAFRLVRFEGLSGEGMERTADAYRAQDLEQIERTPGFAGIVLGENRDEGTLTTISFWITKDAMRASEESFLTAQGRSVAAAEASHADALVDRLQIRLAARLDRLQEHATTAP
ncbi:MAG: hypothetical protein H0U42_11325 [Thermoleophilaceae bacterium]|nr:hypothetical protein [Thermoleophilaceae bacterium]